jgi:hypothetical protein
MRLRCLGEEFAFAPGLVLGQHYLPAFKVQIGMSQSQKPLFRNVYVILCQVPHLDRI